MTKISDNLTPLSQLQSNASHFFNQFLQKHQGNMQCKSGCAQCCHVELSIFESEAALVIQWVQQLGEESKKQLLEALHSPEQTTEFQKKKACVFLRNNQCTIYEARPIICRTQGAVLQFKKEVEKNKTEVHVDVCPLNFKETNSLPDAKEWLDLDRLMALQSVAENFYQKNKKDKEDFDFQSAERKITGKIPSKNKDGRISLKELKQMILDKLTPSPKKL